MIRTRTMRAALSATAALLAVGGLVVAPAQAAVAAAPAPVVAAAQVRAGTPAAHQVVTFLEAYRNAVLGQSSETPRQVRERYLSPYLNYRLDVWAQQNDADPVFRAQNVPVDWSAQQVKEEEGYASVRLTEFWGDGDGQEVWYTVRLTDLRIFDLADEPAF
ncbi:hypothetical protein ABZW03_15705 [Kitasatospora sp. NPDC004799]|uniref:hypothetical protein n=1 Tax=Kitasatospora sp. NPDC004799 TaxID=3154460 RepID=UPI0033A1E268